MTDTEMAGENLPERESMDFDVVIVGAGPAGLAAAIRLKQLAAKTGDDVSVTVLEKGSEVGAHILSGAVIDPVGLDRLGFDRLVRARRHQPRQIGQGLIPFTEHGGQGSTLGRRLEFRSRLRLALGGG